MYKLLFVAVMACSLLSCQQKKPMAKAVKKQMTAADSAAEYKRQADSAFSVLLRKTGEPDIKGFTKEVYRYIWYPAFNYAEPTYIFRLQHDSGTHFTLVSKMCVLGAPGDTLLRYDKNRKIVKIYDIVVLDSVVQSVPDTVYWTLYYILQGSYYWAFENPYSKGGDGYLDGDEMTLESVSNIYAGNKLKYHQNFVHVPQGNYRKACIYLAQRSDFTKKMKWYKKWIMREPI